MSLPKLLTPTHELTLPSNKKKILFRPFIVKEEKALLIAAQSKDYVTISTTMKAVVTDCTFGALDPDDIPLYDLEYVFLQIRCKSVGEKIDLVLKCDKEGCGKTTPFSIDLNLVKVVPEVTKESFTVMLTPKIGVVMKHLNFKMSEKIKAIVEKSSEESKDLVGFMEIIKSSMETIFDENSSTPVSTVSDAELTEFIESLTHAQVGKLQEFIANQPSLKHTIKWKCIHCGTEHTHTFEGLNDFFI